MTIKIPVKPDPSAQATPTTVVSQQALQGAENALSNPFGNPLGNTTAVKSYTGSMFYVIGSTSTGLMLSARVWYAPSEVDSFTSVSVRLRLGDATSVEGNNAAKALPVPTGVTGTAFTGGSDKTAYRSIEGFVIVESPRTDPWKVAEGFLATNALPGFCTALAAELGCGVNLRPDSDAILRELLIQAGLEDLEQAAIRKKNMCAGYAFGAGGTWCYGVGGKVMGLKQSPTQPKPG